MVIIANNTWKKRAEKPPNALLSSLPQPLRTQLDILGNLLISVIITPGNNTFPGAYRGILYSYKRKSEHRNCSSTFCPINVIVSYINICSMGYLIVFCYYI